MNLIQVISSPLLIPFYFDAMTKKREGGVQVRRYHFNKIGIKLFYNDHNILIYINFEEKLIMIVMVTNSYLTDYIITQ